MKILRYMLPLTLALLCLSCRHTEALGRASGDWWWFVETPRESLVQVYVGGDVAHEGPLWVQQGAGLATLEEMTHAGEVREGVRVPINVSIQRRVSGRFYRELRYKLVNMTRDQKEAIRPHHGDRISFWSPNAFPVF